MESLTPIGSLPRPQRYVYMINLTDSWLSEQRDSHLRVEVSVCPTACQPGPQKVSSAVYSYQLGCVLPRQAVSWQSSRCRQNPAYILHTHRAPKHGQQWGTQ